MTSGLSVSGIFAGIGGIELGLGRSGFHTDFLCEWWEPAQSVLQHHFPEVDVFGDISDLTSLPSTEVVAGGFPCTDLSQAGRTAGINGTQSGLVRKALSLMENHSARWLLLENVRNMLPLHGGRAMADITDELSRMGFRWAYRLVDSRFTGVPQRRQRVIILASRSDDPRSVLFADDAGEPDAETFAVDVFGFYWTEGLRGLGWCQDGTPTLKGGSNIGIPSPPAVWRTETTGATRLVTPGISTAEKLQGFPVGWTLPGATGNRGVGARWKMVGNAVTVGVFDWVGRRLVNPVNWDSTLQSPLERGERWPTAAWGENGQAWRVNVSMWPERSPYQHLAPLMENDFVSLSHRGTAGFLSRLERGNLRVPPEFKEDLRQHLDFMAKAA